MLLRMEKSPCGAGIDMIFRRPKETYVLEVKDENDIQHLVELFRKVLDEQESFEIEVNLEKPKC
ncbi:hypothetical protein MBGDF03_00682 [Thermoplasmatales archaeon SCGC AB-540-F20]|nr:hypothetical protein MBGDF03_00682 [Thermoplasmatales archaeon SCGC AB-540-F20]